MLERNIKKLTKMKARNLMTLLTFILVTTVLVWLFNSSTPHLRSFVSRTQLHIQNINSKLQVLDSEINSKKELEVDSTYLELLGFVNEPKLFKESVEKEEQQIDNLIKSDIISNKRIPPLVTAFTRFGEKEKLLIESKMKYFLNDSILIYDLDLSSSEQLKVNSFIYIII
jgi:hypothetical protein